MKKILIILLLLAMSLCTFGLTACDCEHENKSESVLIESTCTQTGLSQTTCTDCGIVLESEEIAKLSHTESEWIIDSNSNCKDSGLKHKECLDCGAVLQTSAVNTEYNHNYIYGECEVCGDIDTTYMTEWLVYSLINNDSEYEVVGYTGSNTDVIIPPIYKGKPVTSIGERAFSDCRSLKSIKYRGSESQWSAINKSSDWNSNTGSYTITYNYTGE